MKATLLEELCQHLTTGTASELRALLPSGIQHEAGHFNVFDLADIQLPVLEKPSTSYACRAFYKVSLISGQSQAEYAGRSINIGQNALIFSTPRLPYHWSP